MNEMDRVFFTYQENKEYVTLEDFLNYKANNISGTTIFMEIFIYKFEIQNIKILFYKNKFKDVKN